MSSTASPLETRRARVRTIRARVAAAAVAVFIAVFGFLFGQLSSGSDPGLTDSAPASAGTTTTDSSSSSSSSSDETWSTNTPSSVQTGQS